MYAKPILPSLLFFGVLCSSACGPGASDEGTPTATLAGAETATPEATEPDVEPTATADAATEAPSTEAPTTGTEAQTPTAGAPGATEEPGSSPTPTAASGEGSLVPSARCAVAGEHHASWGETSHSNDTEPMYAHVFDLTEVRRMDIRMNASDYEAMQAELTELLGAFGEGGTTPGGQPGGGEGGGPGQAPQEAIDACADKGAGDACSFTSSSMNLSGSCVDAAGTLQCRPEGAPAGGEGPGGDAPGGGEGGDTDLIEEDPSFFPVEVEVDGDVWCQVGFRRKGNSTLSIAWGQGVAKLPFRLDFDEFEDDHPETKNQRFFGFKKLTFGNGYGDPSFMRDVLAAEIFRDRGIPAAMNSFVRVYLDHGDGPEYHGLYTMMEDPDDAMMDHVFGDDDGNLYKPQGDCANLTCFDEDSFSKESNDDEADWGDVQAMLAALHADRSDAAAWRAGLEATFDVQTFLKWLAVNTTLENWDSYGAMAQNYYLYGVPDDGGRLTWFPWDLNLSLASNERSPDLFHTQTSDTWPMIRYLLDDEVYMASYRSYLPMALEGAFAVDAFTARAQALEALISPYVVGDGGEAAPYTFLSSDQAFLDSVSGAGGLVEHVESRHAVVDAALQ